MRTLQFCIYSEAVAVWVGSCAPASSPKIEVQPTPLATGRILSMRSVYSPAAADAMRAALLGSGSTPEKVSHPLTEFIVRTDDGPMMSIIQTNEPGFHVGDRVIILHRDRTQLAPPPT